jgi:hypothetical protein
MNKLTLIIVLTLSTIANSVYADQAPTDKKKYQIIEDSVHFTDGRVISFTEFEKENSQIQNKKEVTNSEENKRIIPSWKYYTLMLAFPLFLILLFVLVFVRGRMNKN